MSNKIGLLSRRLIKHAGQHGPVALMYHSITPGGSKPDSQWSVSLDSFKRHLDVIEEFNWNTDSLNAYGAKTSLSKKTVVITFDDGYADNYQAFEELVRRRMTATWYIVCDDIGNRASWKDSGHKPILSVTQLAEMAAQGMTVGSHGLSHKRLNTLDSKTVQAELGESKAKLETILQKSITSLAYPYGAYNDEVVATAKSVGYKSGVSTHCGFGLVNNNPLLIRRVAIMADDTPSSFARKLAFAANDVGSIMVTRYGLNRLRHKLLEFFQ